MIYTHRRTMIQGRFRMAYVLYELVVQRIYSYSTTWRHKLHRELGRHVLFNISRIKPHSDLINPARMSGS